MHKNIVSLSELQPVVCNEHLSGAVKYIFDAVEQWRLQTRTIGFSNADNCKLPNFEALEKCLFKLRNWMLENDKGQLAVPKIGCGLGKLSWGKVRQMIHRVFDNTGIVIEVRYL